MRKATIIGLALGFLCAACGSDVAGNTEMATLNVGLQGLFEETAAFELPAGNYDVAAKAKAAATDINVTVTISKSGSVIAELPMFVPNTLKIPAGKEATPVSKSALLTAGQATSVALTLSFGPADGTSTAEAGMNLSVNVIQDPAAPTIKEIYTYPGPKLAKGQSFTLYTIAEATWGEKYDMQVRAGIFTEGGAQVVAPALMTFSSGLFKLPLNAPASSAGKYVIRVEATDRNGAKTTDTKAIEVQ